MMIDFALDAGHKEEMAAVDAIYQACRLRFRPILMTMAAMLGGMPLALGTGTGSELRKTWPTASPATPKASGTVPCLRDRP